MGLLLPQLLFTQAIWADSLAKFESELIIGGYVKFITAGNSSRYFIYRRSDFESWRKKSTNPHTVQKNGPNGSYLSKSLWDNEEIGGQNPEPNFLRTKIILHAAKEKCWFTGSTPIEVEQFNVEIEAEEELVPITEPLPAPVMEYASFEEVPQDNQIPQQEEVDEEAF